MSLHFTEAELGVDCADERVKGNAEWLAVQILEPLRKKFGPIHVTNGFRDPAHNQRVGGKATSFHLYEADKCAADIVPMDAPMTEVFRWLRMESKLPFHKAILEYKNDKPACIHIQAHAGQTDLKRRAFLGATGDAKDYTEVEAV